MEQFIRSFAAWDERGNRVVLHEFEPVADAKIHAGKSSEPPPHFIRTSAGRLVKRIAKGEYQVVDSGLMIRASDSDAP